MTTFAASATHIATTPSGGQIVYDANGVNILDAVASFIIFFVALCWGAIINTSGGDNIISVTPTIERKPNATPGKIGRVWIKHYIMAVFGG